LLLLDILVVRVERVDVQGYGVDQVANKVSERYTLSSNRYGDCQQTRHHTVNNIALAIETTVKGKSCKR
jgi:hypothetical protein